MLFGMTTKGIKRKIEKGHFVTFAMSMYIQTKKIVIIDGNVLKQIRISTVNFYNKSLGLIVISINVKWNCEAVQ